MKYKRILLILVLLIAVTKATVSIDSKELTTSSLYTQQISDQLMPWGVERVNAPNVWDSTTGENVKVAIIDTGIDYNHEDLIDNVKGGISFIDDDYIDTTGHGTYVAGVIAALNNNFGVVGVAPNADLYAVKIMDETGGNISDLIKAIQWCIDNEMDVVIMSVGTEYYMSALESVLEEAYSEGIILVAAAGNWGDLDPDDDVLYPAKYASVIAVGSTDMNDEWYLSGDGPDLELVAPGKNIETTGLNNEYYYVSGSSIAAPHVTGVITLLKGMYPNLSPDEIRMKLQEDAIDLGDTGKDNYYGYGLAQVNLELTLCEDNDLDGYYKHDEINCPQGNDCDDMNPNIHPEATEVCNGVDDDCDDTIDNGGDALCDDGEYCNGQETCNGVNGCQSGTPIDCSGDDITGIATCDNIPDDSPSTWDYRAAFTSVCDEGLDVCTTGSTTITHTCDTVQCSAECEQDDNCADTNCDFLDGCVGLDYYDYDDVSNDCLEDCTCESNACTEYTVYPNDSRCTGCQTDEDCNDLDNDYCDGTKIMHDDYICSSGVCVLDSATVVEDCDDGVVCNGQETCLSVLAGPVCVDGTPIDCSENDISRIATCTNNPDNNPFTWDYRAVFTSVCDEDNDVCTTGDETITHTCDIATCGAECDATHDCADTECDNLDGCVGSDYYDYDDVENNCLEDCTCEDNGCTEYTVYPNDPRCVVECSTNSDCGTDGYIGSNYCTNDDVYRDYRTYTCNNPGTESSYCSYEDTPTLIEDCGESSSGPNYCVDNDVYQHYYVRGCSIDSCTEIDNPVFVESCSGDYVCENGACVLNCTSHSYYQCYDNDVYWYDSCDVMEEKKEDCGESSSSSYYCVDNERYQHYYTRGCSIDSCTEIDNPVFVESCEPDYVCENGDCVSPIKNKLAIEKVKITYNGKSKTAHDGSTVRNIKPGMDLKLKVYVKNLFTEDIEIEDVEITATIENIDDGDDLEEESNDFDVKAGKSKSETLTFEIPIMVDEDEYTMTIEVEGEDENGTKHKAEAKIELEVEKEKHELIINKAFLSPETVSCGRDTYLDLDVINIGEEDEEGVVIALKNDNLNFNKKEELELDSGTDEDARFRETYFIDVAEDLKVGTYPIEIKVYYDTDRLEDTEKVNLVIEECPTVEEVEEEEEEEVEVILPEEEEEEEITPPIPKETFWEKYGLGLIIAGYVLVLIVTISLLLKAFRK